MSRTSPTMRLYLAELTAYPPLEPGEEKELALLIREGDEAARDAMVAANLALVVAVANQFRNRGLDLEDLVQEGNKGLIKAAEDFDPGAGVKFCTYASYWVGQAIRRALRESRPVKLTGHASWQLSRWRRARESLARDLGREPTDDEIGSHLGLTSRQRKSVAVAERAFAAVNEAFDHDVPERFDGDPARLAGRQDELDVLLHRVDRLGDPCATVIRLKFGLSPYHREHTTREIAKKLRIGAKLAGAFEGLAMARLKDLCLSEPCS